MGDFYFTSSSIWNFTRLVVCFATNAHTNTHAHGMYKRDNISCVHLPVCVCVRVCRQMSIVTCDCSNCILHVFTSNHLIPFLFSANSVFVPAAAEVFRFIIVTHTKARTLSHNRTNTHKNRLY